HTRWPRDWSSVVCSSDLMSAVSSPTRPADLQVLAFWPVTHLSRLIQSHQLSSLELTKLYLDRLKKFNPMLKCAVTVTEKLALKRSEERRVGKENRSRMSV